MGTAHERRADVMGGPDLAKEDNDLMGGAEPAEEKTDLMGGPEGQTDLMGCAGESSG